MFKDTIRKTLDESGMLMFEVVEEEDISHSGVKGQRWGVRRTKKQLDAAAGRNTNTSSGKGSSQKGGQQKPASDTRTSTEKVPLSKVSDRQLRQKINRLEMEKRYSDLTKADPKTKGRLATGRVELSSIAKTSARAALTKHTTNLMSIALTQAIKKQIPTYNP